MKPLTDYRAPTWRREILQVLTGDPGKSCNEVLLGMALQDRGYPISAPATRAQLGWLAEQQLVTLREIGEVVVATVTREGEAVARGMESARGVQPLDAPWAGP